MVALFPDLTKVCSMPRYEANQPELQLNLIRHLRENMTMQERIK